MFGSLVSWFYSLPLVAVLMVGALLILIEIFVSNVLINSEKSKKWLFINLWQVFGVLLPAMWLLRASENYTQVILLVCMMFYFGIYKPARLTNRRGVD